MRLADLKSTAKTGVLTAEAATRPATPASMTRRDAPEVTVLRGIGKPLIEIDGQRSRLRMNEPHLLVADIEAMADGRVGIDVLGLAH